MLQDIPYQNIIDNGRKYHVWMLRDVYDYSFQDIANAYGVSVACIVDNYGKILSLKLNYYVNHLSIVHGHEDTTYFKTIWNDANHCYHSKKYVVAYFEKHYPDMLAKYRNGEPGMPQQLLGELPPLRKGFSKGTIASMIRLREDGMTYATIGKRLRMTKEATEHLYQHHYFLLYLQLLEQLIKITGDTDLRHQYRTAFLMKRGKTKYDSLVRDYAAILQKNNPLT